MQDKETQLQSPFADRLHTNYTPLDPEVEQIHRVISGSLADISRVDEKISHLQSMIDELSREREVLSSFVDAHRALLSGIRRLPSELLQEIFTYCVPDDRRYDPDALINCAKAPILLGRVCSSWRRTVISTPHLWSSLYISIFEDMFVEGCNHNMSRLQQRVAALHHWLELSGSCPLYISFSCTSSDMEEVEQGMHLAAMSLFQVLVPSSQRWEVIDLSLPLSLFVTFFATFTEDVPLLGCISLTPIEPGFVATWYSAPIFRAPSLRSLSLSYLDISLLVVNWNHLIHLDLQGYFTQPLLTTSKALEILTRCTSLIFCRMTWVHGVDAAPASTISLPFLRSLDITEGLSRTSDLTGFFDVLKVPGLRNFRYSERHRDVFASEPGISCKSILSQPHSPGIESIELPLMFLSRVAEYLALLPFLKRLSIRNDAIIYEEAPGHRLDDCDLLTLLTPSSDSGKCLCPRLEEIEFTGCIAITDAVLCSFVTSRTSHHEVTRLKQGKFSFLRPKTHDILPELEVQGLSLNITYSNSKKIGRSPALHESGS